MTTKKRPHLSSLTGLGFQLNIFAEGGEHSITFEDVYDGLDNGTLYKILNEKVPSIDVSLFTAYPDTNGDPVLQALREATDGMRGRERRKYGIEANGLSLLIAYVLEAIQQGYWVPGETFKNN